MIMIYGIAEKLNPIKKRLSEVIHSCMVDVLLLPENKRFHRFFPMERENFLFPAERSDAYTIIEINMIEGRTVESKKALIHRLFERIENELQILPLDVEVTLHEQPAHCWGFRGITGDEAKLSYKIEV